LPLQHPKTHSYNFANRKHQGNDPKFAILFSGGLDCMVVAALAHQHAPAEQANDLLNVAFENPRSVNSAIKMSSLTKLRTSRLVTTISHPDDGQILTDAYEVAKYNVPDRRTGLLGWHELCALYPERTWRFVGIDVPYDVACAAEPQVRALMFPASSVMDYSISLAFWFAAKGTGWARTSAGCSVFDSGDTSNTQIETYTTPAKVLLSGLGADEQLGGYSHHRTAFDASASSSSCTNSPNTALLTSICHDIGRLPSRNCGRDDRIIASHGKEVRYPFLDEDVMLHLAALPLHHKLDMSLGRGIGDKMLLRRCAQRLGLHRASREAKRAVQFGSRTAKLELNM
jgi:asparagine synthetase B (glutamine-hydrolysing)